MGRTVEAAKTRRPRAAPYSDSRAVARLREIRTKKPVLWELLVRLVKRATIENHLRGNSVPAGEAQAVYLVHARIKPWEWFSRDELAAMNIAPDGSRIMVDT